jgi:hypothetical protein
VIERVGWTEVLLGIVIIPLLGNVAGHPAPPCWLAAGVL